MDTADVPRGSDEDTSSKVEIREHEFVAPDDCKQEIISDEESALDNSMKKHMSDKLELKSRAAYKTTVDESTAVEALRELGSVSHKPSSFSGHVCCICSSVFHRKDHLQVHMSWHETKQVLKCLQCDSLFSRHSSLKNHMKIHQYTPGRALMTADNNFTDSNNQVIESLERALPLPSFEVVSEMPTGKLTDASQTFYNDWNVGCTMNTASDIHMTISEVNVEEFKVPMDSEVNYDVVERDPLAHEPETCQTDTQENLVADPNSTFSETRQDTSDAYSYGTYESTKVVSVTADGDGACFEPIMASNTQSQEEGDHEEVKGIKQNCPALRPYQCPLCGIGFTRKKALESHANSHQWTSELECNTCQESFQSEQDLHCHQAKCFMKCRFAAQREGSNHCIKTSQSVKSPIPNLQVKKMQQTVDSSAMLPTVAKGSTKSMHGRHECEQCQKRFSSKQKLLRHMWVHRQKKHICEVCFASFGVRVALDDHRRQLHPGDSSFMCDQCGKGFVSRQGLLDHGRVHGAKQVRTFLCAPCGKSFSSRQGFLIHTRSHSGERPYGCRYCWKAFRDGGTLRKHERIHTGERPHPCPVCQRAFNQKVVLREHVRCLHAPETTPCNCPLCGLPLSDADALCAHIVYHSDQLAARAKATLRHPSKKPPLSKNSETESENTAQHDPPVQPSKKLKQEKCDQDIHSTSVNRTYQQTCNDEQTQPAHVVGHHDIVQDVKMVNLNKPVQLTHSTDLDDIANSEQSCHKFELLKDVKAEQSAPETSQAVDSSELGETSQCISLSLSSTAVGESTSEGYYPVEEGIATFVKPENLCELCSETFDNKLKLLDHIRIHI